MELIERLRAKRSRTQRSLESQLSWRDDLYARVDVADERILKHRTELRRLDELIASLDGTAPAPARPIVVQPGQLLDSE